MGLSVQNAVAVLQGLTGNRSAFIRTPKFNNHKKGAYLNKKFNWINWIELGVLIYFIGGIALSIYFNDYFMLLFFVMISIGLTYILAQSFVFEKPKPQLVGMQVATVKTKQNAAF